MMHKTSLFPSFFFNLDLNPFLVITDSNRNLCSLMFSFHRDDNNAVWQVDLDMMEVLFNSVVEFLQTENAYNIFILNPKRNANRTRYGYR